MRDGSLAGCPALIVATASDRSAARHHGRIGLLAEFNQNIRLAS